MSDRVKLLLALAVGAALLWWVQREIDAGRQTVLEAQAEAAVTLRAVRARAARLDAQVQVDAEVNRALRRENAALRASIGELAGRVRQTPTDTLACLALADVASQCAANLERMEGRLETAQSAIGEAQGQRDEAVRGLGALRDSISKSGLVGRRKWILGLPRPLCVTGVGISLATDGRVRQSINASCGFPLFR